MAVYDLQDKDWDKVKAYWDNDLFDDYKDHTVFQMEPFPKYEAKSITFISHIPEIVEDVSKRFGIKENKYWTSIGSQGLKRLTGINSKWHDTPLKKVLEYTPTSKQLWVKALSLLEDQYDDFTKEYTKSKHGKNKSERENAEANIRIIIEQTKKYIRQTEEVYEILTDGDTSDFGRSILMDEFSTARFFERDMRNLIAEVKRRIDQL